MKLSDRGIMVWWRVSIVAGGVLLVGFAFFSFLLYQRVNTISNRPVPLPAEERPILFSPSLLDDMKAFWEKRGLMNNAVL